MKNKSIKRLLIIICFTAIFQHPLMVRGQNNVRTKSVKQIDNILLGLHQHTGKVILSLNEIVGKMRKGQKKFVGSLRISMNHVVNTIAHLNDISVRISKLKNPDPKFLKKFSYKLASLKKEIRYLRIKVRELKKNQETESGRDKSRNLYQLMAKRTATLAGNTKAVQKMLHSLFKPGAKSRLGAQKSLKISEDSSARKIKKLISQQKIKIKRLLTAAKTFRSIAKLPTPNGLSNAGQQEVNNFNRWLMNTASNCQFFGSQWQSYLNSYGNSSGGFTTKANQASGGSEQAQFMLATKEMQEMNQSFNLQYLQLQQKMQGENRQFTAMSNIMKTKHNTAKNAINNVR